MVCDQNSMKHIHVIASVSKILEVSGGGWNVEYQNIEESEHRKYFQNNQNVKSKKDQSIKSVIRMSKSEQQKEHQKSDKLDF